MYKNRGKGVRQATLAEVCGDWDRKPGFSDVAVANELGATLEDIMAHVDVGLSEEDTIIAQSRARDIFEILYGEKDVELSSANSQLLRPTHAACFAVIDGTPRTRSYVHGYIGGLSKNLAISDLSVEPRLGEWLIGAYGILINNETCEKEEARLGTELVAFTKSLHGVEAKLAKSRLAHDSNELTMHADIATAHTAYCPDLSLTHICLSYRLDRNMSVSKLRGIVSRFKEIEGGSMQVWSPMFLVSAVLDAVRAGRHGLSDILSEAIMRQSTSGKKVGRTSLAVD